MRIDVSVDMAILFVLCLSREFPRQAAVPYANDSDRRRSILLAVLASLTGRTIRAIALWGGVDPINS